jgi:hypothetical protein
MTTQAANVSVVTPLTPAIERVKTTLFRPFDLSKWLIIGFCAWLAWLGQSGGGGGGGGHFNVGRHEGRKIQSAFHEAKEYVLGNLEWILPLAVVIVVLILVLWLLVTWLSSRGHFMFLHCVAGNKAEVRVPWTKYARHSNSLFLFRIGLGLFQLLLILPLVVVGVALLGFLVTGDRPSVGAILGLVGLVLGAIGLAIIFGVIGKLLYDFVVPIMFLRTASSWRAWGQFLSLVGANKGRFLLYLLFSLVLGMGIGLLVIALVILTCCCAGCLLALPYLGTVLFLPVLTFSRSYSLYYLAQYGPEWDVFRREASPAIPVHGG